MDPDGESGALGFIIGAVAEGLTEAGSQLASGGITDLGAIGEAALEGAILAAVVPSAAAGSIGRLLNAAKRLKTKPKAGDVPKSIDKADTLKPGPFAKESIPAHRGKPTAAEQRQVNELMEKHGCHTCGTKNAGTKSGNAVADHQPPQALNGSKEFFPHCINCARRQGGQVRQEKLKRGK